MSATWPQLRTLLRTMIRIDFRSRSPLGGGRKSRRNNGLVVALLFYLAIGGMLGVSTAVEGIGADARITLLLTVVSVYLIFSILAEYQQILLAPEDGDILYWRPIPSRTLFVARSLHIFLYVNLLSAALLAVPSLLVALEAPANLVATWLAFVVAGTANAALTTGVTVLLYSVLLRHVPTARLNDVLVWFQVVTSLFVFLGYQALGPLLQKTLALSTGTNWIRYLPSRWFAALPEMAGWGVSVEALTALAFGIAATAVVLFVAVQHLAPQYQSALAAQAAAAGSATVSQGTHSGRRSETRWANRNWLPQLLGRWAIPGSAERAGFDFFLAMFRGDSRLKTALLPMSIMPLGFVLFAALQGSLLDPYATGLESVVSADPWRAKQALRMPFIAAYFLVLVSLTLARSLSISSSWKAGWVFYASPMAQFERFHRGVVWGAVATLIAPTATLLVVLLWILWRSPLHVMVHLAVPLGLVCLILPITLWARPEPPFSRESMRHDRVGQWLYGILPMLPLFLVGALQYQYRANGGILLLVGTVLAVVGSALWWVARRHVRTTLHAQVFDG